LCQRWRGDREGEQGGENSRHRRLLVQLLRTAQLWHLGTMATAPPLLRRFASQSGKRGFANRARGFANRAAALPGFPYLWIAMVSGAVVMTVTGAFNTGLMPLPVRAAFWALLSAWALAKWQLWFVVTVRRPADWLRAALLGALLLNLLLPFEIALALAVFGVRVAPGLLETWARAFVISGAVFLLIFFAKRRISSAPAKPASVAFDSPLLARAGVALESLVAIEAEDHYCRVRRADGGSALIHYRFGDALAEMAGIEGAQVHRGTWVAAAGVRGAVRDGRRWRLRLADGESISVSASHLAVVRARGWLKPPPA